MAIRQNKEEVVAEFLELMYKDIKTKFSDDAGIKNVVYHLVEIGLVEPKRLRNYMIIYDFDCMLRTNEGNRTYTFMDLSIKYNISERQAQSIVYKERRKQSPSENITY